MELPVMVTPARCCLHPGWPINWLPTCFSLQVVLMSHCCCLLCCWVRLAFLPFSPHSPLSCYCQADDRYTPIILLSSSTALQNPPPKFTTHNACIHGALGNSRSAPECVCVCRDIKSPVDISFSLVLGKGIQRHIKWCHIDKSQVITALAIRITK